MTTPTIAEIADELERRIKWCPKSLAGGIRGTALREAAALIRTAVEGERALREALERINRKASPDPERTMSEASNDLYWCACEARLALGGTDAK